MTFSRPEKAPDQEDQEENRFSLVQFMLLLVVASLLLTAVILTYKLSFDCRKFLDQMDNQCLFMQLLKQKWKLVLILAFFSLFLLALDKNEC